MRPPFEITPLAADLLSRIERMLGRHEGAQLSPPSPLLRRSVRVRTIQASLAIEGNTLTEDQVTAVLEGKHVVAPERDLVEVKNAIACYERLPEWQPYSTKHLLAAHKLMMTGLVDRPGAWRSRAVAIAKGSTIAHLPPPANRVPGLVGSLFDWMRKEREVPAPILAAICHYELEFIHPFEDGNGRLGRLWHSLILARHHLLFTLVPIESAIRERQADYYNVLGACDRLGNSTPFIEFSLQLTLDALSQTTALPVTKMSGPERIEAARHLFGFKVFSRKDYKSHFPALSTATASRDLQAATLQGALHRLGDKATARYQFI